jgi:nucleotide-binding universal stress UspA family protein
MYKRIIVALDGSEYSLMGGKIALTVAQKFNSSMLAVHVYDGQIHSHRLREMEPVLPPLYQDKKTLEHVRQSHNELIYDGFKALSKGYMEAFEKDARNKDVEVEQLNREGRNYLELVKIAKDYKADLMVTGAYGLGMTQDCWLGSTAVRVLRLMACDTLIVRKELSNGNIMVGVDGSKEALKALAIATEWACCFEKSLQLVAAYDPYFHGSVFKAMAGALSQERQEQVGINKQKDLHDNIVDEGLGKLYRGFLEEALKHVHVNGIKVVSSLLRGKAYRAIADCADENNSDIIVVGKFGHHRDDLAQIGSNSENITRIAEANVLITGTGQTFSNRECKLE